MVSSMRVPPWPSLLLAAACGSTVPAPLDRHRDAGGLEDVTRPDLGAGAGPDLGGPDASGTDAAEGDAGVRFVVRVPTETGEAPPVHIAGDFQGWDPADPDFALRPTDDGRWTIRLPLPPGRIEYKYVRGDWSRVEKAAGGGERAHRAAVVVTGSEAFEDAVAEWADRPTTPSTLTGDVRRIELIGRTAMIYLPPGYEDSTATYPLLIMFDGQNLFDARTAFAGEWNVDETAEQLIADGAIRPLIVVGLYNGGAARIDEYTPWADPGFDPPGGGGAAHLSEIVDEALPELRRRFRITSDRREVALAGSSLGGLMTVYAAFARPEAFGKAAGLSPSLWWADRRLLERVRGAADKPPIAPLIVDMGTREAGGIDDLRALGSALEELGFVTGQDLFVDEVTGAGHDEAAWRRRFPSILRRLFPAD